MAARDDIGNCGVGGGAYSLTLSFLKSSIVFI
eukprot:CAMPEP_0198454686 /NCGR_PEP_ID=MMETSP1453-20131121/14952_1 /TAXON_ID=1461543 ORGANISM="Unidentified sp., Strain RCC701" /NCGR_SAMPLE_ID=MMETSP1453 /ASSEMBLY_ACC=CAM_ASM_001118 /LENGTH=31 /DNA_ID= /DNA_START= /DNA_END= /DNA_ORIENTATION=